jgi:CRISPR-associated exonuclease Cas4
MEQDELVLQSVAEEQEYTLTASHLLEYLYCPRFTYFEYVLDIPQHQEKRFKVEVGRTIHEKIRKMNADYLRKKIGVREKKSDVYLSGRNGIRGIIDEILFLNDGTAAPLDYKYAEYKDRTFKNHRFQLVFYAQLIKDNYNIQVNRGFIVYTRSRNKLVEVQIKDKDFYELEKILRELIGVIVKCKYPKPTRYRQRCPDCCYRNICERSI